MSGMLVDLGNYQDGVMHSEAEFCCDVGYNLVSHLVDSPGSEHPDWSHVRGSVISWLDYGITATKDCAMQGGSGPRSGVRLCKAANIISGLRQSVWSEIQQAFFHPIRKLPTGSHMLKLWSVVQSSNQRFQVSRLRGMKHMSHKPQDASSRLVPREFRHRCEDWSFARRSR